MNISAVSSGKYNISFSTLDNDSQSKENIKEKSNDNKSIKVNGALFSQNKMIQAFENQKGRLQEQIEKIKESESDPKIKQERISELKKQIEEIDVQIQQTKLESMTKKKEDLKKAAKNKESKLDENNSKDENNNNGIDSSKFQSLTEIDTTYSEMKNLSKVRTDLKGKARVAASEIALDASRGQDVSRKIKEFGKMDGRIKAVEKSIMKKGYEIQEEIESTNDNENTKEKVEKSQEKEVENQGNEENKNKPDLEKERNEVENRKSLDLYI
ncbi:coiled-coil domain-containing protein [Maledivibacter halophilus]|uniref:Uncharacterized protein n=1 Tax=Maledivibacter halophilus TaxID=36842 RepID=A0A1T5LTQ6_9FIRM|nr:hypothetical protein [Maledivibacter halophilus]SKC79340.1 hypothetical protein SAMN02194393_03287 [Maledivibacter halophilus]